MTSFNEREFRDSLGTFATGITVVTSTNADAAPLGITVNSFTSVSLTPPLILWCLDDSADSYNDFVNCENFAVHVLHEQQEETSRLFATRQADKFAATQWTSGEFGAPVLHDYFSCFQCETENTYTAGDHIIIIGRVRAFDVRPGKRPLVYHGGNYRLLEK